MLEKKTDYT